MYSLQTHRCWYLNEYIKTISAGKYLFDKKSHKSEEIRMSGQICTTRNGTHFCTTFFYCSVLHQSLRYFADISWNPCVPNPLCPLYSVNSTTVCSHQDKRSRSLTFIRDRNQNPALYPEFTVYD